MKYKLLWSTLAFLVLNLSACKLNKSDPSAQLESSNGVPGRPEKLRLCTAFRGNGNFIFAHWGALSSVIESYGPVHAVSGGSSGSITAFLYESVYQNPAVWTCDGKPCGERRAAARMSFLMKSMREFVHVIGERIDFMKLVDVIPKLIQKFNDQGFLGLLKSPTTLVKAAETAIEILKSDELGTIIDRGVIKRLNDAKNAGDKQKLKFLLNEIKGALAAFEWKSDDRKILMGRGLVNFEELIRRVGIAGDLYAGKDSATLEQTRYLLDICAESSMYKQWNEVKDINIGTDHPIKATNKKSWFSRSKPKDLDTCGKLYDEIANQFFDRFFEVNKDPQRLSDPIGKTIPTFAATSIFEGTEPDNQLRADYNLYVNNPDNKFERNLSTDWLKFGYWGQEADLKKVQENKGNYKEFKTSRFHPLGTVQWGEAMRVGPQEPGLGSILCNTDQGTATHRGKWDSYTNNAEGQKCLRWSLGAWSDLYPVQVLKNLGCEKVVYITRRDDESQFIQGVVKLLTKDPEQWADVQRKLFDLNNEGSSASTSLKAADAAVCSDWNKIPANDIDCMQEDSYSAPLNTTDPFFTSLGTDRGQQLRKIGFAPHRPIAEKPIRGCQWGAIADDPNTRPNPCPPKAK